METERLEIARPLAFLGRVQAAGCKSTLQELRDIYALPLTQQLSAMQSLGQDELDALSNVEKECNIEVAYLLQNLAVNTVASTITQYKRILSDSGLSNHPYEIYFKLPRALSTDRRDNYRESVMQDNKVLRPIHNIDGYINAALSLINSDSGYMKLAMGLCALTGRRPGEILVTAKFEKAGDNSVIFHGQLKTKESDNARDGYEIPVLAQADMVINALGRLRGMKDFTGIPVLAGKTLGQAVNARTAKEQGICVRANFEGILGIEKMKPYDMRAVYALICKTRYKPATVSDQAYMAGILGHAENDTATAASYLDFYIAD